MVSATLATEGDGGERLHVLSCYAPIFAASREAKEEFYGVLQEALSTIPPRENFVMLGDFNARIGSRSAGSEWGPVMGPHGYGN